MVAGDAGRSPCRTPHDAGRRPRWLPRDASRRPCCSPPDAGRRVRELHLVAAARPNLPKLAALWHALGGVPLRPVLLHTGQHQDPAMFGEHLGQLGLPAPEIALGVQGRGHAELTGRTMMAAEAIWRDRRPAWVVVA